MPISPTTITIFAAIDDNNTYIQLQNNAVELTVTPPNLAADLLSVSWNATPAWVRNALEMAAPVAGTSSGTITLSPNASDPGAAIDANLRDALKNGTNVLAVFNVIDEDTGPDGEDVDVTIQFRAVRTTDFILTGGAPATLQPAYHSGAPASNFHTSVSSAAYTFSTADVSSTNANGSLVLSGAVTDATMITNPVNRLLTISDGAASFTSELSLDIHIPTDVIALLDRSGSMNAVVSGALTRWGSAHQVAGAFSLMFKEMVVQANAPQVGTVADQHKIDFGYFYNSAGVQTDFAGEDVGDPAELLDAKDGPAPPAAAPGGSTPIVQGIVNSATRFPPNAWRRRHIVLLTDGIHNVGSPNLGALAGMTNGDLDTQGVPVAGSGTANAPTRGVTIHTVSYSEVGETETDNLAALAMKFDGQAHVSATDPDPLSVSGLFERFLDVLSSIIPLERQILSGGTFSVEDYLDRMMVIAGNTTIGPDEIELTDNMAPPETYGPAADPGTRTTVGANASYHWLRIDRPRFDVTPGAQNWTASLNPATNAAVLYDLALTMKSGATRAEPGQPITVWTEITHLGKPLSGADVRTGVARPGESLGALLTRYVRSGKLGASGKRSLAQLATHNALAGFDPQTHSAGVNLAVDNPAIQRILLSQVEELRNLSFQYLGSSLQLEEVRPGRYEGVLAGAFTQEEGSYGFKIRATGTTAVGAKFGRDRRVTTAVVPMPDEASSETTVVQVATAGGQTTWQATVLPMTVTKRPLGPGLGHSLSFYYLDAKAAASLPPLVTVDNLDGTYSAKLTAKEGQSFPPIGFSLTAHRSEGRGIRITEPQAKFQRVKVTLNRIQILDDKDGCLTGAGELVFEAVVSPNANPNRAVRTRLPEKKAYKANSGETITIDEVLFDGHVEHEATLAVTIGGKEFDWFLFFQRKEPLARYHRLLTLKKGTHTLTPDDEPNDPESLADWKVWYTVQVS